MDNETSLIGIPNFGIHGDVYYKAHIHDTNKPIAVSFSFFGASFKESECLEGAPSPWGFDYLKKIGMNVISFCCVGGNNWYTMPEFHAFTNSLGEALKIFPKRLGYGGSMGAFGASCHSNNLGLDQVLLLNPLSTLCRQKAPFEYRFRNDSQRLDWLNTENDGANCNATGYVVYDPIFKVDALHAYRYTNLTHLRLSGVGHSLPVHLNKLDMLGWLLKSFINGNLDVAEFHYRARARRSYNRFYNWLLSNENVHLTPKRAEIIKKFRDIYRIKEMNYAAVPKNNADKLRDLAIKLENSNIELAHELMLMANQIRPEGPYINKKINQYKEKIKKLQ